MDEEDHLSFFLEWHDPQAGQLKPYILHFYGDQTLELIERNTRRTFLKRIRIPTVSLKDLYIGASVSIYSRQLTILEAANEYTRNQLKRQASKASFIVLPKGYRYMGKVLAAIELSANGDNVQVVNALMLQFEASHLAVLSTEFSPQLTAAQLQQQHLVTKDVSLAIEVKLTSSNALEDIQNKLEAARLSEFVLMNDNGLDKVLSACPISTTAVMDNCSLCLVRPRILRDRQVGQLVDEILTAGFEISALKLLHFTTADADEFFRVYKGITRQYHEMLKYMTSAPCIAVEVRGDDVVRNFREFCGPHDVEIARALRPKSVRARFGKSNLYNAVHCTDCPEDGVLETQFVFTTLN